ncbi:hypothetical protein [Cyclobacterium xiamenense]|uniref:hypothetical protein n=1 Tax=Cyclobacterium xiamenense TaxID=1297121 RepID=UPI0012B962BB|nr:hypothetical protein [Cyclobacterium xiamenense]
MKRIPSILFLLSFGWLVSCQYTFPEAPVSAPDSGEADFSKMITIGSSITAGVMDGALYNRSQQNSFAVILAEQMKAAGGGAFNVPEIDAEVGSFILSPPGQLLGRLILRVNGGSITPEPIVPGNPIGPFTGDKSSINNFGVNGISLAGALFPEAGDSGNPNHPLFNPHYARFASNPGTSTLVGDAAAALADGGTFFVFWLGKNDVLPFAIAGGAVPELLTDDQDFLQAYQTALGAMLRANPEANGAVGNIPDLNSLPFFSTVPWNALPLSSALASLANGAYTQYNQVLDGVQQSGLLSESEKDLRQITFTAGQNGFVIEDKTLTDLRELGIPSIRLTNAQDKVSLTAAQVLGQVVGGNASAIQGVTIPLGDQFVLLPSEQALLAEKIDTFNQIIQSAVALEPDRLVLVDVRDLMNRVAEGTVNAGTVPLSNSIIPPNGGFSTDGIHPNARANAFLANHFIEAINQKWGSTIPLANPNAYMGNDLPR